MEINKDLEFLAKDEEEAIKGYDKVIAQLKDTDKHLVEQLTKIRDEEIAHLDFLRKAQENPKEVYEDPGHDKEQGDEEVAEASKIFKMNLGGK